MSDWFDSDGEESPAKRERTHKAHQLEAAEVRPPPRPPYLDDQDRLDKRYADSHADWLKHEAELNKRHRSFFDGSVDEDDRVDHALRDESEDAGEDERSSPET